MNECCNCRGLSDLDVDGRLSCDEFVLAMHLCDIARSGEKVPDVLPLELRPPQMRRASVAAAAAAGAALVASPVNAATPTEILIGLATSPSPVDQEGKVLSPVSFEDKRKENFDKGIH